MTKVAVVTAGGSGIAGTTLGAVGGNELMQQHTHTVTDPGHVHGENAPTPGAGTAWNTPTGALAGTSATTPNPNTNSSTTGITIQNAGSGASQNVQPSIVCNYIIRII